MPKQVTAGQERAALLEATPARPAAGVSPTRNRRVIEMPRAHVQTVPPTPPAGNAPRPQVFRTIGAFGPTLPVISEVQEKIFRSWHRGKKRMVNLSRAYGRPQRINASDLEVFLQTATDDIYLEVLKLRRRVMCLEAELLRAQGVAA